MSGCVDATARLRAEGWHLPGGATHNVFEPRSREMVPPDLPSILHHVVLTYSAVIDRSRRTIGQRLIAISTSSASGHNESVSALLQAMQDLAPAAPGFTMLAPFGLQYDEGLLALKPPPRLLLEVPFMVLVEPGFVPLAIELAARGYRLAVRGRGEQPMPQQLLPLLKYALISIAEDRRRGPPPPGVKRRLPFLMTGSETVTSVDEAFCRGAAASIGWPLDEPLAPSAVGIQPSAAVLSRLLALSSSAASPAQIEEALKLDAGTVFKLLRFLQTSAFGAPVAQVSSLSGAIARLGPQKLTRWLELMRTASVADGQPDPPVAQACVRRGLFMQHFGYLDTERAGALYIAGVLSLMDKIALQPIDELMRTISVSDDIRDAVVRRSGPLADPLLLIEALEKGVSAQIFALQSKMGVSAVECNAALLSALGGAAALDALHDGQLNASSTADVTA